LALLRPEVCSFYVQNIHNVLNINEINFSWKMIAMNASEHPGALTAVLDMVGLAASTNRKTDNDVLA
jgi:hypothetical protein